VFTFLVKTESQWFLAVVLLTFQTLQIADVDALAICFFRLENLLSTIKTDKAVRNIPKRYFLSIT